MSNGVGGVGGDRQVYSDAYRRDPLEGTSQRGGALGGRRVSVSSVNSFESIDLNADDSISQMSENVKDSTVSVHKEVSSFDGKTQKEIKSVARKIWRTMGSTLTQYQTRVTDEKTFMDNLVSTGVTESTQDRVDALFRKGVPMTTLQDALKGVTRLSSLKHRFLSSFRRLKAGLRTLWKYIRPGRCAKGFSKQIRTDSQKVSIRHYPEGAFRTTIFSDKGITAWQNWWRNNGNTLELEDIENIQGVLEEVESIISPYSGVTGFVKKDCIQRMDLLEDKLLDQGTPFDPLDILDIMSSPLENAHQQEEVAAKRYLSDEGKAALESLDYETQPKALIENLLQGAGRTLLNTKLTDYEKEGYRYVLRDLDKGLVQQATVNNLHRKNQILLGAMANLHMEVKGTLTITWEPLLQRPNTPVSDSD